MSNPLLDKIRSRNEEDMREAIRIQEELEASYVDEEKLERYPLESETDENDNDEN
ncbi:hypothetical protein [Natrononativus amylolyticus]|uniref:hypothetical protein n=1 Tax=Natrononativus amylolyticus TaxID=2963434 RepID=UPI0020CB77DC|nr:hypothetical protein [Natrononativus amylolyticus]